MWRLLVVLSLILLGTLIPVRDVGVRGRPQCVLAAMPYAIHTPSFARVDPVLTSYTLEERDYLIRTIAFEAPNEPALGKAAVAHVILNRKRGGRWGETVKQVVTKPWQFEPWMTRRKEIEKLSADDPRYRKAARIADAVLGGEVPDPTAGATHFLNPTVVRKRRNGSLPSWAQGEALVIGRHAFYSPDESSPAGGGALPSLASLAKIVLGAFQC